MKTIKELEAEREKLMKENTDLNVLTNDMIKLGKINKYFRESLYNLERIKTLKDVLGLIDEFDINNFTCKYCEGEHGDDDWSCDTDKHEQEIKKEIKARINGK